jgi:amino acid permease
MFADDGEADLYQTGSRLSTPKVVVGILNGMIGGTILILPLLCLGSGYLTSLTVCALAGFICYYTAHLIVTHIGKSSIREWITEHFHNKYGFVILYDVFSFLGGVLVFIIYFKLICLQFEGLLQHQSSWIAPLVAALLIVTIIFNRIFHLGEEIIAYGIFSTVAYVVFILWTQVTAPSGPYRVP